MYFPNPSNPSNCETETEFNPQSPALPALPPRGLDGYLDGYEGRTPELAQADYMEGYNKGSAVAEQEAAADALRMPAAYDWVDSI